jgi:hypothetical protein
MRTFTWLLAVGITVGAVGCSSTIEGGGGGSGGAGGNGGGGPATTGSTSTTTTGPEPTTTTATTTTGTVTTSTTTTGGGGNALGNCEFNGGSAASSGGGTTCETDYLCDGGSAQVECTTSGDTNQCDCWLDGELKGSCDGSECSFPQSCCFDLLGGSARPNPGPYGLCDSSSSTATGSSGGSSSCVTSYECEGGTMTIACDSTDVGATCQCKDGQDFVIGTCDQPGLSCDYGSSCCYDILN